MLPTSQVSFLRTRVKKILLLIIKLLLRTCQVDLEQTILWEEISQLIKERFTTKGCCLMDLILVVRLLLIFSNSNKLKITIKDIECKFTIKLFHQKMLRIQGKFQCLIILVICIYQDLWSL